jgi:hypothetical protein
MMSCIFKTSNEEHFLFAPKKDIILNVNIEYDSYSINYYLNPT